MQKQTVGRYKMGNMIGNGCFGHVFEGLDTSTMQRIAWKRMVKASKMMSREYEILAMIKKKKYVIELVDFFYSVNHRNELIQNFIFPFCETNLEEVLKRHCSKEINLSYMDIKKIIFQIITGLEQIHALNICHRDLKPENILVKDGSVLISDFGSSKVLSDKNTPYVVSRYYRAPELILGIHTYNLSIDMFSVGVIFYEFLMKRLPFKGKTEGQQLIEMLKALGPPESSQRSKLRRAIVDYDYKLEVLWKIQPHNKLWKGFHKPCVPEDEVEPAKAFIKMCWNYDFANRIKSQEAKNLPFFDDVRNNHQVKALQG